MVRVVGAALLGVVAGSNFGGDTIERQYLLYNTVPVGEDALRQAGWHKHDENGCDPHLGFGWTRSRSGATKSEPLVVYTTAGGQSAGVGTIIRGDGREQFPTQQQKWASSTHLVAPKNDPEYAHIDVAFRSGTVVCSGGTSGDTIGDVIIVNPAGPSSKMIPLMESGAAEEGWRRGSCLDGMGTHWFLDTSRADGTLGWGHAENIFPVVAMYHEGEVNAIFFAVTLNQISIPYVHPNRWEPAARTNAEMCENTCDDDCDFGETPDDVWSTMHIFLKHHSLVKCPSDWSCAINNRIAGRAVCCEAKSIQV